MLKTNQTTKTWITLALTALVEMLANVMAAESVRILLARYTFTTEIDGCYSYNPYLRAGLGHWKAARTNALAVLQVLADYGTRSDETTYVEVQDILGKPMLVVCGDLSKYTEHVAVTFSTLFDTLRWMHGEFADPAHLSEGFGTRAEHRKASHGDVRVRLDMAAFQLDQMAKLQQAVALADVLSNTAGGYQQSGYDQRTAEVAAAATPSEPTSDQGYWDSLSEQAETHVEEPEEETYLPFQPAPTNPATVPCPEAVGWYEPHAVAECFVDIKTDAGDQCYVDLWNLQHRIKCDNADACDLARVDGTGCDLIGEPKVTLADVWDYLPEPSRAYIVEHHSGDDPEGDDDNDGGSDDDDSGARYSPNDERTNAFLKRLGDKLPEPAAKDPKAHSFTYQYNDGEAAPVGKGYADAIEAMRTEAKAADKAERVARGVRFAEEVLTKTFLLRSVFTMTLSGTMMQDCVTWEALRIIKSNRMDCVMRLLELVALEDYDCTPARVQAELAKLTPEQVDNIRAIGMEEIRACNVARREVAMQAEAAVDADFDGRMAASHYTPKVRGRKPNLNDFVEALADMLKQWNTCGYRTGKKGDFADCAVVTATRCVTVARGATYDTDKRPCDSAEAYLTYDGAGYDYLSTCADYGGIEWMREQVKAVATAWGFTTEEHSSWALAFYVGDDA